MVTSMASNVKMNPTYFGYIGSTKDALLIIQAVLNNRLLAVPRRPQEIERPELIKSGNVFVFVEEKSGIKRWTDGVSWSPSRILGRFLVYRELDRPVPNTAKAGEKGKGDKFKKPKRKSIDNVLPSGKPPAIPAALQKQSLTYESTGIDPLNGTKIPIETDNSNTVPNRSLVGSLIASYAFKEYGLIKKTMSLTINKTDSQQGVAPGQPSIETVHLVSYYSAEDVLNAKLQRPVDSPVLKDLQLSNELWNAVKDSSLGGKIPFEDESYYFMDESNPNAIALGFNPAIHLQPQYQQHNQQHALQPPLQQQPSQQSQDSTGSNDQSALQNSSSQLQGQKPPQQASSTFGQYQYGPFNPSFGLPQYSLPQQYAQPLSQSSSQPNIQESQAPMTQIPLPPRAHHHSINHPIQHPSQSTSFSLPVPQSHDYNNNNNSNPNFQDLSQIPIQYQQQPLAQSHMRYSPNQNFVISHFQHPTPHPQGDVHTSISSTSSSGYNLQRPASPNSPRGPLKHESDSPIVPATHSSMETSYNLSTPRQQKSHTDSPGFIPGNFNNSMGGTLMGNIGNPYFINPATGAPMPTGPNGHNGNGGTPGLIPPQTMGQMTPGPQQVGAGGARFFYDENGQIGSFGFQPYANNSGAPN